MNLDLTGQISEDSLRFVQHLDETAAATFIIAVDAEGSDKGIKFSELGFGSLRQFFATTHNFLPVNSLWSNCIIY